MAQAMTPGNYSVPTPSLRSLFAKKENARYANKHASQSRRRVRGL